MKGQVLAVEVAEHHLRVDTGLRQASRISTRRRKLPALRKQGTLIERSLKSYHYEIHCYDFCYKGTPKPIHKIIRPLH